MKSKNFNNWIVGEIEWKQIDFDYTTKNKYQHPQDLKAVFWNSYIYYQQKVDGYFKEFNEIPLDYLRELIFKFRQSFPQKNRVPQINYFDDLIEQLIEKHNNQKVNPNPIIENKRYWLKSFSNKEAQKTGTYKSLKNQIDENGSFNLILNDIVFKIYTPELALILISDKIDVEVLNRGKKPIDKIINGNIFQETYFYNYTKGIEFFEKNFLVTTNTLYGENAKQYVKDLHFNYFHNTSNRDCFGMGWNYYKKNYPLTLTNDVIKKFGYYSGILSKIDELIDKHPLLFKDFDTCQSETPQPIDKEQSNKISDLITHQKSLEIVEKVKIQYKNIKGKRLKLLLMAFQELNLLPKERVAYNFYKCCENEFEWNIASYNAMNGHKFNEEVDSEELKEMKRYIETIIKTK